MTHGAGPEPAHIGDPRLDLALPVRVPVDGGHERTQIAFALQHDPRFVHASRCTGTIERGRDDRVEVGETVSHAERRVDSSGRATVAARRHRAVRARPPQPQTGPWGGHWEGPPGYASTGSTGSRRH